MTTIDMHNVKSIELSKRRELPTCATTTRIITVTYESGESVQITLFAKDTDSLDVRGDRL